MCDDRTDDELIALIAAGKSAALEILYQRYAAHIYQIVLGIVQDRALAEDLVQEVFWRVWRRSTNFAGERGQVAAWLRAVARNLSLDELWRIRARPVLIRRRNQRGERWFSYSFGISYLNFLCGSVVPLGPLTFVIDDWVLYSFVEPILIYVASIFFGSLSGSVGSFLALDAVTMLIKNNYVYGKVRGRILDMIDAEIEQDHMEQALRGEDKWYTAGFTLVRPRRD